MITDMGAFVMKRQIRILAAAITVLICITGCSFSSQPSTNTFSNEAAEKTDDLPSLTIGVMQKPDVIDYESNDFTQWLEENLGIDLCFTYFSYDKTECCQQLSRIISTGGRLPDILFDFTALDLATSFVYGEEGVFIDLLPYFSDARNFSSALENGMSQKEDCSKVLSYGIDPANGELYGFPEYQYSPGLENCRDVPMINRQWLDQLGYEMPETVSQLREVLMAFRDNDMNDNGLHDEIPSVGSLFTKGDLIEYLINAYVYCNSNYLLNVDDGVIWAPYDTEEYRQGLIELNKWYSEGLISPYTFSLSRNEDVIPIFCPSDGIAKAGLVCGHPTLITDSESTTCFDYVFLPPLLDETGKGGFVAVNGNKFLYQTFITKDCREPKLAFDFLDFLCSKEAMLFMRYGKEERDWRWTEINGEKYIHLINANTFSERNSVNYHVIGATIIDYSLVPKDTSVSDEDFQDAGIGWDTRKLLWQNTALRGPFLKAINDDGRKKQERVEDLVYNKEETAIVSNTLPHLKNCIQDHCALFITGVLDPASDIDWSSYISALDNYGYYTYIRISQNAFERMTSN